MCEFFSCVSDGKGKVFYLNAEQRKEVKRTDIDPDSHSSIVKYYQDKGLLALKPDTEDKFNKYEYNPITKEFSIDQLNTRNDSKVVEQFCQKLDFKTIVPELIIKPIINPFIDKQRKRATKNDIERLKEWSLVLNSGSNSVSELVINSVITSVLNSAGYSVYHSVGYSVYYSVYYSVRNSVGYSVRNSVINSVLKSVGYSAYYSVDYSTRNAVYAYISSFFKIDKWSGIDHEPGENPFQCCIDLWESGIVPSFDGNMWRLHGHKGKIVFEIKQEELNN